MRESERERDIKKDRELDTKTETERHKDRDEVSLFGMKIYCLLLAGLIDFLNALDKSRNGQRTNKSPASDYCKQVSTQASKLCTSCVMGSFGLAGEAITKPVKQASKQHDTAVSYNSTLCHLVPALASNEEKQRSVLAARKVGHVLKEAHFGSLCDNVLHQVCDDEAVIRVHALAIAHH